MSVNINVELEARGVVQSIAKIEAALASLDTQVKETDIDFGEIDVGEITGEIGEMVRKLNNMELNMNPLKEQLDRIEEMDGLDVNVNTPDGSTNSGDSTGKDPDNAHGVLPKGLRTSTFTEMGGEASADGGSPGRGLNDNQMARMLENVGGFERGSVEILGDFDADELNELAADIENTTQGLTSDKYPWIGGNGDGNLEENQLLGNFHDQPDPSEMDWSELQKRAGEAEVFQSKEELRNNIQQVGPLQKGWYREKMENLVRSQQFGGKGIRVKMPNGENLGIRKARRRMSGALDVPMPGDDDDIDIPSFDNPNFANVDTDNLGATYQSRLAASRSVDKKPDMDLRDVDGKKVRPGRLKKKVGDGLDRFETKLSKFKPTMGKYMQLLAAIIPIAVSLGTQLLGVAAAMGSVAAAGGAMIGLGLLGHGDSMAESFGQAKVEMRELKREMFQTFQPRMQQFAPIQSRAFDAIPDAGIGIAEEMEGLDQYEETLFNLGAALTGGFEKAIGIIVRNDQAISQLSERFGGILGSGLLQFFDWLIQSASKNQDLLVKMGSDMMKLAASGYNLAMAVTKILSTFSPMFEIILGISRLLNNDLIAGMASAIGWIYAMTKAGYAMFGMIETLKASTASLATVLKRTGIGALLMVGGYAASQLMMPEMGETPASTGSGGKTVYNDNRSFQIEQKGTDWGSQKSMENTVYEVSETERAQELPPVDN